MFVFFIVAGASIVFVRFRLDSLVIFNDYNQSLRYACLGPLAPTV